MQILILLVLINGHRSMFRETKDIQTVKFWRGGSMDGFMLGHYSNWRFLKRFKVLVLVLSVSRGSIRRFV